VATKTTTKQSTATTKELIISNNSKIYQQQRQQQQHHIIHWGGQDKKNDGAPFISSVKRGHMQLKRRSIVTVLRPRASGDHIKMVVTIVSFSPPGPAARGIAETCYFLM